MVPNNDSVDLTQWDDEYEQAPVEERSFDDVPDGKYQVNVEKAEMTHSKTSGLPMLKWTFKILGPTYAGRLLWKHAVITNEESVKHIKGDLAVCGLQLPKFSQLPQHTGKLLDLKLEISKQTRGEYENIYINKLISGAGETTNAPTSGGSTRSKPSTSYAKASQDASKPF